MGEKVQAGAGILRHHLQFLEFNPGRVLSFPFCGGTVLSQRYLDFRGLQEKKSSQGISNLRDIVFIIIMKINVKYNVILHPPAMESLPLTVLTTRQIWTKPELMSACYTAASPVSLQMTTTTAKRFKRSITIQMRNQLNGEMLVCNTAAFSIDLLTLYV